MQQETKAVYRFTISGLSEVEGEIMKYTVKILDSNNRIKVDFTRYKYSEIIPEIRAQLQDPIQKTIIINVEERS